MKERILAAGESLRQLRRDYESLKVSVNETSQARIEQIKLQMAEKKLDFEFAVKQWRIYLRAKTGTFSSLKSRKV